ncbi:MAG: GGDEF domain-containing protein [Candidatus Zipacnadales bacterium]
MDPRDKVTNYVHENVSRMLRVGEPKFDEEQGRWYVPVISDVGERAEVLATYVLDRRLRFVRNPVKQLMDRLTDQLSCREASAVGEEELPDEAAILGDVVSQFRPLAEHAQEISLVDALTGIGTASALLIRLNQEIERTRRYNTPFCLAFLDVEDLWSINLEHGPLIADALIAQVGRIIERVLRGGDFVAHWAGARFGLLMQGAKTDVLVGASRILGAVRGYQPVVRAGERPLTVSATMGGASCPPSEEEGEMTAPALIKKARGMLMAAKAAGGGKALFS